MFFGWLCTRMLLNMYRTHGTEQGWEALHLLWTLSVTVLFLCSSGWCSVVCFLCAVISIIFVIMKWVKNINLHRLVQAEAQKSSRRQSDTIMMRLYTLLVSAVPAIHSNAGNIDDSTESVTPASLTLLTQLLSPPPAFLRVCWSSHPSPSQTQVWPAPQASLSHLIQLAPFDTQVYTRCSQFHSRGLGWKWILIVYVYANIGNIVMM